MDAHVGADTVSSPVHVPQPELPERSPRESVDSDAARMLWEDKSRQSDMTLKHSGEAVLLVIGRGAEMECPSDVGCAALVLSARVDQHHRISINRVAVALLRSIVHDRAVFVGSCGRDQT